MDFKVKTNIAHVRYIALKKIKIKKIGQLFPTITVLILKVIEIVFKLPSWKGQGTTKCQRGQYRLGVQGEDRADRGSSTAVCWNAPTAAAQTWHWASLLVRGSFLSPALIGDAWG